MAAQVVSADTTRRWASIPSIPAIVYIGFQELWLSTDGGGSFTSTAVTRNLVHWDHHALVFSPASHASASDPTPLYVGEDGGIARSEDGGSGWTNLNGPTSGDGAIATNLFRGIGIGRDRWGPELD